MAGRAGGPELGPTAPGWAIRAFTKLFSAVVAAWLLLASPASARPPDPEAVPPPLPPCGDVLRCRLSREIALTDRFLRERRYGLPYTLDPRPLDYPLEMLRLNVMSQAMGYLNLYRAEPRAEYRSEALSRIEYLLGLGDAAFGNGPRDGMYGYLMLDAYDLLRDGRCLEAGRRAAERCAAARPDELTMNGGLMCALNHAYLARFDGVGAGAAVADGIVERTSPKQFEDGAFPHLPYREAGRNTNYSSWMANELVMLRDLRPQYELTEFLGVHTIEFLAKRVGPNGEIVYRDSLFDYASDPGGSDTRGWTSELASVALNLAVSGRRDESARVLAKLFATRMRGESLGGYPDKYAFIDANNAWESGRPSVLRTSLVFWFLTMIRRFDRPCGEPTGPCVVGPDNCTELYREVGLCDANLPAARTCLAGRATRCYDAGEVRMKAGIKCGLEFSCESSPDGACFAHCLELGSALCVGDACRDQCLDPTRGDCEYECFPGRDCPQPRGSGRRQVAMLEPDLPAADRPLDLEPSSARRDDLSLQLIRVSADGGAGAGHATLRVHHHGDRPAVAARVVLSSATGEALSSRSLALATRSSLELTLPCSPCSALVARLDAGAAFLELDTLNNVARGGVDGVATDPPGNESPVTPTSGAAPALRALGALRFVAWMPSAERARVSVHDVAGRRVRTLWEGTLPAGEYAFEWDGRDAAGARAERGVYFVRLVTPAAQAVSRVLILR